MSFSTIDLSSRYFFSIKNHPHRKGVGGFFIINVCLFFALVLDKKNEGEGLEDEVDDVADAEGQNKGAGLGNVGESPDAEEDQMEEEGADGEPKEVFDEGARVFVEAFHYGVVLYARDNGKVEGYERHDGLENAVGKPQSAEGRENHDYGYEDKRDIVFFHDRIVLLFVERSGWE